MVLLIYKLIFQKQEGKKTMTKKQLKLLQQNNINPQLLKKSSELQSIKDKYVNSVMFGCLVNCLILVMFGALSDYRIILVGTLLIIATTAIHSYISMHNYRIDIANYIKKATIQEYKTLLKYFYRYSKKNQLQYFIASSCMEWKIEHSKTLVDGSERITMVSDNGLYHFTVIRFNNGVELMYNFYQ